MKFLIVFFIFINQVALASECTKIIDNEVCIRLDWLEGPHLDAFSSAKVSITKVNTNEALNVDIKVYPWMIMDGHEHGSMEVYQEKISDGVFLIEEIFFFSGMEGIWNLRVNYNEEDYLIFTLD